MASNRDEDIDARLRVVKEAVRKATAEALKAAACEDPRELVVAKSAMTDNSDATASAAGENEDPNTTTTSNSASFALGVTLFGQELHVVEREIRDRLDKVDEELESLVLTVKRSQTVILEEGSDDDEEEKDSEKYKEKSSESLQAEADDLKVKIQFLRECSSARSLLDEANIVSSSGSAHDPDWVQAARLLAKAQLSLKSAEELVRAEEERPSSSQALLGAYRILDAIRVAARRKRVQLLSKATKLLESSVTISSTSISVQGSRLGSRADGVHASYDILEALSPEERSDWNSSVRNLTDRLFQVVFQPLLKLHKDSTSLASSWTFREVSDTSSKRTTVATSKPKGPSYVLEWSRADKSKPAPTTATSEENVIEFWGETLAFVSRVMSFVEERILLQRVPLCNFMGGRLFGKEPPGSGSGIDLAAFGLESDLLAEKSGLFMKPVVRLLMETCVPEYLDADGLGRLKGLAAKLQGHTAAFEKAMLEKNFLCDTTGKKLPLSEFSEHFELKYVEKRRVSILVEARRLILETDYHNTVEVGVDVSGDKDELLGDDDGMSIFQLHKSAISQTSSQLMDLCQRTMDEAVATRIESHESPLSLLPPTLYRAAREVLDLFRAMIPATLGGEVATVPRTAAVLHNDCVFLAHHCLTLGLEYKEKFPPLSSPDDVRGNLLRQTCIFVDMVPPFRELAERSMGNMLERQQNQLAEVVGSRIKMLGEALRSNQSVAEWSEAETAVKAGLYHLRHLAQAWRSILSHDVFVRSIGHLVDAFCTMLIDQVLKATDISEPASHFVSSLFRTAGQGITELLGHDVEVCRSWDRFNAFGSFMSMSLADINAGLTEGVFRSVTAPELSRLITATFDDSSKRRHLLKLLAAET